MLLANRAASGFDRRLGTPGGTDALEDDLACNGTGQDDLGAESIARDDSGGLQGQQIDLVNDTTLVDVRYQASVRTPTPGPRTPARAAQPELSR